MWYNLNIRGKNYIGKTKLTLNWESPTGQLRARSSRVFRLKGQTIDTPFTVETTIDFDECEWKALSVGEQETLRLKVKSLCFLLSAEVLVIVQFQASFVLLNNKLLHL